MAVEHDQIELAAPASPVLADQAQPLLLQVTAGERFGLAAALPCRAALHQ
jgi:hypothetical protein